MATLDVVAAMREFHLFYTEFANGIITMLFGGDMKFLDSRVFFEIAVNEPISQLRIQQKLNLERSGVSRTVSRLEAHELIYRETEGADARMRVVRLTPKGREFFNERDERQRYSFMSNIAHLSRLEQEDLVDALTKVRLILSRCTSQKALLDFRIRPFRTGDVGTIALRQSKTFASNHENSQTLELLESELSTAFLRNFDPISEQCFVAEIGLTMVGAVVIINGGQGKACIHLLYVEQFARRHGIATALLTHTHDFAKQKGYKELILTLQPGLDTVRQLCIRNGFHKKPSYSEEAAETYFINLA